MVDYTKGRYNVFASRGPTSIIVGRIDEDEFVRNDSGKLLYRIDDDEFYAVDGGAYIGRIESSADGRAMVLDRSHNALFTIVPE